LPNLEELKSLLALNCAHPAIDLTVFPNSPIGDFWTSSPSPFIQADENAWFVGFSNGFYGINSRGGGLFDYGKQVRLVRSEL